jgi:hypothetical protein
MVVSAASVLGEENQAVLEWMKEQRIARGQSLVDRFIQAKSDGQLVAEADPKTLGQYYALVLHGLSVQARDGYSKEELSQVIHFALKNLDQYVVNA